MVTMPPPPNAQRRAQRTIGNASPNPVSNPVIEYLPDILFGAILVFMSWSSSSFGLGPASALGWLGCAALLIALRRNDIIPAFTKWWPILLVPLMCFLSFFWSELPSVSFRYGLQLFLTAVLGVFIATTLSPKRFAVATFVGMFAFCTLSIINGRQGISAEGWVLIGLTGSKNSMAFCAYNLVASSMAILFLPGIMKQMRILGVVGALIGIYIVSQASSATATIITILACALFVAMCIMQRFSPAGRIAFIIFIVVIFTPLLFIQKEINDFILDFMVNTLHKDPTLTGRTYLWERADDLISRKPWLGHGFQAFWLGDTSDTIGILRWSGQSDGRVFNFHNTYRQIGVDIGLVGMGLLILTFASALIMGLQRFIMTPNVASSFAFTFLLVAISKSFTELIIAAFSSQTVVLYATLVYAFAKPAADAFETNTAREARPAAPPPQRMPSYNLSTSRLPGVQQGPTTTRR